MLCKGYMHQPLCVDHIGTTYHSYNAINGVPACADGKMMNHMLRDMFGFDGFVVSDYGAIPALQSAHHYVNTTLDGVVAAISAG